MDIQIKNGTEGDALAIAHETLDIEIEALRRMRSRIDGRFNEAVEMVLAMQGRVVVVGMGKSGIIGQKIAATLASTGTPAFFVHPGEAFHGDLGMIKPVDVALLISNSGETEEVLRILPFLQHQKNRIIALTGKMESTLARHSHVVLDVGVEREACKNNLAPTSSTTNTLAMGDALAVALTVKRDFQPEDFARFHPGGNLGKRLLTNVSDVMQKGNFPVCEAETSFRDVVGTITSGRLGLVLVMDGKKLEGVITDGDIRRAFENYSDISKLKASQLMSSNPLCISDEKKYSDAESYMLENHVKALVVKNRADEVVGILDLFYIHS